MARKRGGLAGLYDRNKGVIQAAAPVLAGAFGGPLAGAAVGAAMKGLDREGKSGIGFDVKQGMKGGLSGYASGAVGKSLAGGLKGRLAEFFTGSKGAAGSLPPVDMASKIGITPGMAGSAPMSVAAASPASVSMAGAPASMTQAMAKGASRGKSLLSRAAQFAEKNPNTVGQAAKLAMSAVGPDNEGRALALREQQYQDEQEAAGRRAGIAAQLFTGGSLFGAVPSVSAPGLRGRGLTPYLEDTTAMGESFPDDPRAVQAMQQGREYMENYGGSAGAQRVSRNAQARGAAYRYPR